MTTTTPTSSTTPTFTPIPSSVNIDPTTGKATVDPTAAIAAANANAGITAKASDGQAGLSGDFNFFLKMLTTQLQNQDPTAPMDVSQMTSQIAQYSGVEQQLQTNNKLDQLLSSNKQSQMSTAVSYIGKEIETEGNTGMLNYTQSGDQSYGQAVFSYILPTGTTSTQISILDSTGAAVFTGAGTVKDGRNVVVWDGMNSFNGQAMPTGAYTIQVTGKDATGKALSDIDTRAVGQVDTVETDASGNLLLNIGTVQVKYSDILAVREPTPIYVPNPPTTGDTADSGGSADSGTDSAS